MRYLHRFVDMKKDLYVALPELHGDPVRLATAGATNLALAKLYRT